MGIYTSSWLGWCAGRFQAHKALGLDWILVIFSSFVNKSKKKSYSLTFGGGIYDTGLYSMAYLITHVSIRVWLRLLTVHSFIFPKKLSLCTMFCLSPDLSNEQLTIKRSTE